MNKKILVSLTILVVLGAGIFAWQYSRKISDNKFLSRLKGQVVFTKFDQQSKSFAIWTINANGTNEKMIYRHKIGGSEAKNFNCGFPEWSRNGLKIYFVAMKDNNEWGVYEIDEDGQNLRLAKNPAEYSNSEGGSRWSREKDLVVKKGSVYYKGNNGQEREIYHYSGHYQIDTHPGAREVSWSPDRKYIIFEKNFSEIYIADLNGHSAKLTNGNEPDWKY